MNDRIVEFVDEEERRVRYLRYSARVPEFLARFPPDKGYRVETDMTDLLSLKRGLLSIVKEAIAAGRELGEIFGLPAIQKDLHTLVCKAKLIDPNNRVVRDASASADVLEYKDFETLETAANQRLLAAVGIGGEVFNLDEQRDFQRLGLTPQLSAASPPRGVTPTSDLAAVAGAGGPPAEAPSTTLSPAANTASADEVPDAQRRQIENLARSLNEELPELKTKAEADAALARLGALKRQRRAPSAA